MRTLGIIAAVVCFIAGIQMWTIWGGGEGNTIFEAGYHAMGTYFIAKGIFFIAIAIKDDKKAKAS
jgi:hypothetical protein